MIYMIYTVENLYDLDRHLSEVSRGVSWLDTSRRLAIVSYTRITLILIPSPASPLYPPSTTYMGNLQRQVVLRVPWISIWTEM